MPLSSRVHAFIRRNLVGFLALFVALGGTAYAQLGANSVGPNQLQPEAVGTAHLQDRAAGARKTKLNSLGVGHLRQALVERIEKAGEPGPQGEQGEQGPPGPATGPAGGDLTGDYPNPLIAPLAVTNTKIADGAVTSEKVAGLGLEDLGITVTEVTVDTPALSAGSCAFVGRPVPGLTSGEGVVAFTGSDWDNRLMITGVESGTDELALEICNWTPSTNLGDGSGTLTLLRF